MLGEERRPIRLSAKRILIIVGNAYFLRFLKETLRVRFPSMQILEAANGEGALQKIRTFLPDAILLGLQLPGVNGLEITQKIEAEYPNTTVIVLTNDDLPEYREAAYQSRADHFISKDSFLRMINSIPLNGNVDQEDSNSRGLS